MDVDFAASRLQYQGVWFSTGRRQRRDVIIAHGAAPAGVALEGGQRAGAETVYPASYDNMLLWERVLAAQRKLIAINQRGPASGFGAGNRMVLAQADLAHLTDQTTLAGWDGIHAGLLRSTVPIWYIQQSIVRELIPEGVPAGAYPGIGHTGGYGPREFLRAGLFAYASLGGYAASVQPIGADADHAIIVGYDEESLQKSIAFNKLAMTEARDYTKFTVDTSHLFNFPVTLSAADEKRVLSACAGKRFTIANILPGRPGYTFRYSHDDALRMARTYWMAATVHKDLYDHAVALCDGRPFDYELSLDETPQNTPPADLFFYMLLLHEVMGLPSGGIASAGPNIGFTKRHDYEGDVQRTLWPQVNACASILQHFGAMLSVHSADGVRAATGKGVGVDAVLRSATGGVAELKVADVYQEVLWSVLAASPVQAERDLFIEAWRRTYDAAKTLGTLYASDLAGKDTLAVQKLLATAEGQDGIRRTHGEAALRLAQGTIGYGMPVFKLAANLWPQTDVAAPDPEQELFRRFMFLTYRSLRPALFQTMTHAGWQRLSAAIEQATMVRLHAMGWAVAGDQGAQNA